MRHDISTATHDAVLYEVKQKDLEPVNVSVVSSGEEHRYTVLYRNQNLGGLGAQISNTISKGPGWNILDVKVA
ncbi:MAG: hypothetical protein H0T87_01605 [Gammaproteobacteria bacterium]|nr:hypothetical protein [Gammaproteobacteria bacterium]